MEAEEMGKIIEHKSANYNTFQIPKKNGGYRLIESPKEELKDLQRDILSILKQIKVDKNAHGFVDGKGIYTNAKQHVGSVCIVNIDLKDFFHSVTKEMVIKELSRFVSAPHAIAELSTLHDRLPMGSPLSPCLSNIVAVKLDRKLGSLAKRFDAVYTRYADDITFSSKTNKELHKIIPKAHCFIKGEGFVMNYKKIEVMRKGCRQVVTGLTVNDKVNVPRPQIRKFRAELHQTTQPDLEDIAHLRGYASFIMGANREKGIKYFEMIKNVAG